MRMPAALLPLAAAAQMPCVPPFPPPTPPFPRISPPSRAATGRPAPGANVVFVPRKAERREQTRY
jgi:hypothetical protein